MGYELRRSVRDALPPGLLTQGERAVLLELADDANDNTRQAWPGLDELARRVDMDPASVSKCLQRLARKGIELRVAVGKDTRGRAVFAHSGRRTTYRIPVLPSEKAGPSSAHSQAKAGPPSGLSDEEGRTTVPRRADHGSQKGGPRSAPSPHVSSMSPQQLARAHARGFEIPGATDEEAADILAALRQRRPDAGEGLLRILVQEQGQALLDELRDAQGRANLRSWLDWAKTQPECPDRIPGGALTRPDGRRVCRMCQGRADRGAVA